MINRKTQFAVKGMQRDLSVSKFNSNYAYENKNIRITATDSNDLLSITNEKGNMAYYIDGVPNIEGIPIGKEIIDNKLILFTAGTPTHPLDSIYMIWKNIVSYEGVLLFEGVLDFDTEHPIEAISFYENEDIKKIYWTDGINPPRMINIAADAATIASWTNESFDFVRTLNLQEIVTIEKSDIANGIFSPGTIQYTFTYYNKYAQESNIFYTSPLFYTSFNDRGGSPEDRVSNSFDISITDIDESFDYVRMYSIHRTSIDAIPEVKRVTDLSIIAGEDIFYVDTGTSGDTVDPTVLLYVGGEDVLFGTMAQKDNTLFLGDIKLNRKIIPTSIKTYFKTLPVTYSIRPSTFYAPFPEGSYPYTSGLNQPSTELKTFKSRETYRFGVQGKHTTGKWSEAIFIQDAKNDKTPSLLKIGDDVIPQLPKASVDINDSAKIQELVDLGYTQLRGIIVKPSMEDRSVICQGVLNPTVYNVDNRANNAPFAMSSWFARPNLQLDVKADANDWDLGGDPSTSPAAMVSNEKHIDLTGVVIENVNKGSWSEFRHNHPIPDNTYKNAEIQCISEPPDNPYVNIVNTTIRSKVFKYKYGYTDGLYYYEVSEYIDAIQVNTSGELTVSRYNDLVQVLFSYGMPVEEILPLTSLTSDWTSFNLTLPPYTKQELVSKYVSENKENFYIDQSILTLHSPDIEFDDFIQNMDLTNFKLRIVGIAKISATTTDVDITTSTPKLNKEALGFYTESVGTLNLSPFGLRGLNSAPLWYDAIEDSGSNNIASFVVYPWHRNGSLTNSGVPEAEATRPAHLKNKKMSNLRYSYYTEYLNTPWNAYIDDDPDYNGITPVSIFNSNELSILKIPSPENSNLQELNYSGNIDKIINNSNGYPIKIGGTSSSFTDYHSMFINSHTTVQADIKTGVEPISIKYKSSPHAVFALNYTDNGYQVILPSSNLKNTTLIIPENYTPFWDEEAKRIISHDNINTDLTENDGYLYIAEFYRDDVDILNRFGGTSESALESNLWIPAGESVNLIDKSGNTKTSVTVEYTEGDTYFQRYDNLKTYPYTLEDQNSVTDITSFMCETRVNLDGRYDRNRGNKNNLTANPTNFNLFNPVYNQYNNYFNYRTLNSDKFNLDYFPNTVTWTKSKIAGELIDTWTNITLASTLDLDGDKGKVNSIQRFNNELIAFQDTGISNILFNSRVQIPTSEGVPIEIANSYKVDGKRYISESIGTTNKWSIAESPFGLYFVDNTTKGIYLFNGKLENISDKLGFQSWLKANSRSNTAWDPENFLNFTTHYDAVNKDVMFVDKFSCLAYNEMVGQFTSFYSYEKTPFMFNLEDSFLAINKQAGTDEYKLWVQNDGYYNRYFGAFKPFYTTVIANAEPTVNKIFSSVAFRADTFNNGLFLPKKTFDELEVWNEYQRGKASLVNSLGGPSNLKRRYRTWRAHVPRDGVDKRNRTRISNPWAYVKLSMNIPSSYKTVLHDIEVDYFI